MTNFWETNFAAHLGGFFEFAYTLLWGPDLVTPEVVFAEAQATLLGFESIRQGARA